MAAEPALRVRREPPPFRPLTVARIEARTPHLVRVTLHGSWLTEFEPPLPGGSARLLIPAASGAPLDVPAWDGNAFFLADGRRPLVRTVTPLRHDARAGELDVEVVLHGDAPLSRWARDARPGDTVALSGPGRGYVLADDVTGYLLVGDESAIPAIAQLVGALPVGVPATVVVEVAQPDARLALTDRADVDVRWVDRPAGGEPGAALVPAVVATEVAPGTRVWAAGEAAAMQRIRRHLFDDLGLARADATVRGYWKEGSVSVGAE